MSEVVTGQELFTHQTATCVLHGQSGDLATFVSPTEKKEWEQAGTSFGGVIIKDGPLWAVAAS